MWSPISLRPSRIWWRAVERSLGHATASARQIELPRVGPAEPPSVAAIPKKANQTRTPDGMRWPGRATSAPRLTEARATRSHTSVRDGRSRIATPLKKNDPIRAKAGRMSSGAVWSIWGRGWNPWAAGFAFILTKQALSHEGFEGVPDAGRAAWFSEAEYHGHEGCQARFERFVANQRAALASSCCPPGHMPGDTLRLHSSHPVPPHRAPACSPSRAAGQRLCDVLQRLACGLDTYRRLARRGRQHQHRRRGIAASNRPLAARPDQVPK